MSQAGTARPHVHFGEEDGKSSGHQLLVNYLLAMAPGVQGIPLGRLACLLRICLTVPDGSVEFRLHIPSQGFAPFGHAVDS